jgi:hypothetical protein
LFNLFKRSKPVSPEATLDGIELHIKEIPGAIEKVDGFPRINWARMREAVKPYSQHPALDLLWTELAAQWLGLIREHSGKRYDIYEGKHLLLLSAHEPATALRLAKFGDYAYARLEKLLQRSQQQRGFGKHVVMHMKDQPDYYDYVSYFHGEGERGKSAGLHISRGYRHTVINGGYKDSVFRTLAHELAHDMVSKRPLPHWLNEGLAQWAEDMVPGYRPPLIDARQARLHHRYWSWFGLAHFWNGRGFPGVGSQRLSYQLADILFRNMANHPSRGRKLHEFLATADRKDSGAAACEKCFGCSLAALVEEFLGPGLWDLPARAEPD